MVGLERAGELVSDIRYLLRRLRPVERIEMYSVKGPPCDRSVIACMGSPISATRASTSDASRWRSPGSSSSAHVRGAATVGSSRPRSE